MHPLGRRLAKDALSIFCHEQVSILIVSALPSCGTRLLVYVRGAHIHGSYITQRLHILNVDHYELLYQLCSWSKKGFHKKEAQRLMASSSEL